MKFKRGKGKYTTDFGLRDMYKFYKEKNTRIVDLEMYRKICKEYNEACLKEVVYEGYDHSMEARLGSIRIRKFNNKPKLNAEGEVANKFAVNWPATHELWHEKYEGKTEEEILQIKNKPVIYHLNDHTDSWVMKWYWDKITCNVLNQSAYRFEPTRTIKREAAKAWKTIPGMKNLYYE